MPYWSAHETWGVNAHLRSETVRRCLVRLSRSAAWGCVYGHPVAGAALGSTAWRGATPQSEGLVQARDRARLHTPGPAPLGSLPSSNPCGKAIERRCMTGKSDRAPVWCTGAGLLNGDPAKMVYRNIPSNP